MNSRKKSRQALAHLAGEVEITGGRLPYINLVYYITEFARLQERG